MWRHTRCNPEYGTGVYLAEYNRLVDPVALLVSLLTAGFSSIDRPAFVCHRVKPSETEKYKAAAEKYYTGLIEDPDLHVKLTGSWETIVGPELDSFVHILEFENYSGYDRSMALIKSKHASNFNAMRPFINSRWSQLCQEFAFFPSAPPHNEGGIFELRSYTLQPGALLEWENAWRVGIEARKKVIAPVGAWFSQVGRLHVVHHMWQYQDLNHRKLMRERAWSQQGWPETVVKTARLADIMDASILKPLPFSPLK
ncbi:NIPSNAP-domain-containing protein [Serendipita vermifera]|nr:NIPSNAP-domain-containing protein [Serendipita vermifera]